MAWLLWISPREPPKGHMAKQYTQAQVYGLAAELRKVLKSEAFLYAVDLLKQDYQNRFFTSKPEDKGNRERAYLSNSVLDDLIVAMNTVILSTEYQTEDDGN